MFNNFNSPFGGTGYQYTGQPVVYKQWLTPDELQSIVNKGSNQLSLQITEDERRRAICNHRTADGTNDVIVPDGDDGTCKCLFCGYRFKPVPENMSKEEIQECVDSVVDILQTVKLFYVNFPPEAAREYMQIIPLLLKLPQLFDYAVKDFVQHAEYDPTRYNSRGMSAFSMFNSILGGVPQTGVPNQYAQQMGYTGMPGMNPAQGVPGSNGFGYYGTAPAPNMGGFAGQPQMGGFGQPMPMPQGYQPQTQGFQYQPQQQVAGFGQAPQATPTPAQPTPVAPSAVPTVSTPTPSADGSKVDVQAKFKP